MQLGRVPTALVALALAGAGCPEEPARQRSGEAPSLPAMGPGGRVSRPPPARPTPRRSGSPPDTTKPLQARPAPQKVGGRTITAERCAVEGATFLGRDTDVIKSVAVDGAKLYLVDHRGAVWRFDLATKPRCRLVLDRGWGQGGALRGAHAFEKVSANGRGLVVASGYLGSVAIRDGKVAYACKAKHQGKVSLAPGQRWGLACYSGSDVQRLEYGPTACRGAAWYLTNLRNPATRLGPFKMVDAVGFHGPRILVAGALARQSDGWNPQVVAIYDRWGKEKRRFGALTGQGEERFGWIQAVAPCPAGPFCALDSTNRRLTLWSAEGELRGAVDVSKLLGIAAPHPIDLAVDARGGGILVAAERRAPTAKTSSGTGVLEGVIFRVTGL